HYQLGLAYMAKNDFAKAGESFSTALSIAPDYTEAIMWMAHVDIRKGDYPTAIASLKRLVQQHPELAGAKTELAAAYTGQGNLEDLSLSGGQPAAARQRMEAETARNPKDATLQMLLAKVYLAQKDVVQAEAALKKTIELQPDGTTPYFLLARLYVDTNQHEKA